MRQNWYTPRENMAYLGLKKNSIKEEYALNAIY